MKNYGRESVNGACLPWHTPTRPLGRRQYPGALKGCGVKTKSGTKCLAQCVPGCKYHTILFFKIKFVLRDLLDSVKFIVFLWKFLHLEIYTCTPFLPCFMVIEAVVTKPWPINSDCPVFEWKYFLQRATITVADAQRWRLVGNFGSGYKSCNHPSNLWYSLKDSTRYPRQIGPIGQTPRASKTFL